MTAPLLLAGLAGTFFAVASLGSGLRFRRGTPARGRPLTYGDLRDQPDPATAGLPGAGSSRPRCPGNGQPARAPRSPALTGRRGEGVGHRLDLAGNPSWLRHLARLRCEGRRLAAGRRRRLPARLGGGLKTLLFAVAAGAFGFFLPDILIYNSGTKRQDAIRAACADALDLLVISVEAGLGFDAALAQVAQNTDGPLAGEFFRVLQEMQIGVRGARRSGPRRRTDGTEVKTFIASPGPGRQAGDPDRRRPSGAGQGDAAQAPAAGGGEGQKVPVKILFPMIFFIFPALFVVILGPGVIAISATL